MRRWRGIRIHPWRLLFFLTLVAFHPAVSHISAQESPVGYRVTSAAELFVPTGYRFHSWSPDGNFISCVSGSPDGSSGNNRTLLFDRDGLISGDLRGQALIWRPDSRALLVITDSGELKIEPVSGGSGKSLQIDLSGIPGENPYRYIRCFNRRNGHLVYNIRDEIRLFDPDTQTSSLLYRAVSPELTFLCHFAPDLLVFSYSDAENRKYIYRLDNTTRTEEKLCDEEISQLYAGVDSRDVPVFYATDRSGDRLLMINAEGSVFGRINMFPLQAQDSSSVAIINLQYSDVLPNGNMIAATVGEMNAEGTAMRSGDIYLFSDSGEMKNLTPTPDRIEMLLGWSPSGGRMVYLDPLANVHYLVAVSSL